MAVETTYTALRAGLSGYLDRVTDDREVVIIRRRGARDVAMVPADELSSLMETAYLLRRMRRGCGRRLRSQFAATINRFRRSPLRNTLSRFAASWGGNSSGSGKEVFK
jgi:prevent-host-death family protein